MWGRTCFCLAQLGICVYGWPPECPTRVTKRWKLMGWQMVLKETEKLPLSFTWPYAQCSGAKNHIFFHSFKKKKMDCLDRQVFQSVGNGQGGKSFPLFYTNSWECPHLIGRTRAILMHGKTWSFKLQLKFEKCRELIRILVL